MKITSVSVLNVLGISAATIAPKDPIVIVAGENGAGKSSLYQAMRLALFDELPRVDLKKEAAALVRGGVSKGSIDLTVVDGARTPGGETTDEITVTLPDRRRSSDPYDGMLALCMDPLALPAMEPQDRARLLLRVSGVSMRPDAIKARLAAHGVDPIAIDEIGPLLVLGFEKCAEHAKDQAKEARGAWRQLTGETYGSVKAATWAPAPAGALPETPTSLEGAVEAHRAATQDLTLLRSFRKSYDDHNDQRAKDRVLAPKLEELRALVATLKITAESDAEKEHLNCPECGMVLDLVEGKLVAAVIDKARKTVKPKVLAQAKAAYATAVKDLATVEAAVIRLAEPGPQSARPTDEAIVEAEQKVLEKADVLRSITDQQQRYAAAVEAVRSVDKLKEAAAEKHALVVAWEAAAAALEPTGIPSELMKQALTPFREALRNVCASEAIADWPLPDLSDDGVITAYGRPYAMLSESEQYRAGLLLATALAIVTGVRLIAMDRADVLSPARRGELLSWLADMVDGEAPEIEPMLDQAWIFCTLKAAPSAAPEFGRVYWIENGGVSP